MPSKYVEALADLAELLDRVVRDATSDKREANHLQLAIGPTRQIVRMIAVPTPRPRAHVLEELAEHLERCAADPFHAGAVATYGATIVIVPERIALRFVELDPSRRPT